MSDGTDSHALHGPTVAEDQRSVEPAQELPLGTRIGRYTLLEAIGEGGMGVVHRARDTTLGRDVAIKTVRSAMVSHRGRGDPLREIEREAQALAKLSHPNVVAIYDVSRYPLPHGGQGLAIVMELLRGRNVRQWAKAGHPPWREVLDVFLAAGRGIAAAHEAGLLHRDIKPSNIVLCEDGSVRVVDFGLARDFSRPMLRVTDGHDDEGMDLASIQPTSPDVEGTPAYMSPEQHLNEPLSSRSDQYNFCASLAVTLGGRPLWSGDTLVEVARAKVDGRIDTEGLHDTPPEIVAVIMRGLVAEPVERHPSMDALLDALERLVRPRRRSRLALGLMGLVGLGGLGGLAAALAGPPPAPTRCEALASSASELWPGARREGLHAVLEQAGALGVQTIPRVDRLVEEHLSAWHQTHQEVCSPSATSEPGVTEPRLLCLTQNLDALERTLDVLAEDGQGAVQAVPALLQMRTRADCAAVGSGGRPVPTNTALAERVAALRGDLEGVDAQRRAGRYELALESATTVHEATDALEYPPLRAEAMLALARVHVMLVDMHAARVSFEAAYYEASSADYDVVALASAIGLVGVVGAEQVDGEEAAPWIRAAESIAVRLGHPEDERIDLAVASARAAHAQGRHAEAQAQAEDALSGQDARYGAHDLALVAPLEVLAMIHEAKGEFEDALTVHRRSLGIREAVLGEGHPKAAGSHNNIAIVLVGLNRLDEAQREYEQAIEIWKAALGPDHPDVALGLNNLATVYSAREEREDEARCLEQALAIWERAPGTPQPQLAMTRHNLGRSLGDRGESRKG